MSVNPELTKLAVQAVNEMICEGSEKSIAEIMVVHGIRTVTEAERRFLERHRHTAAPIGHGREYIYRAILPAKVSQETAMGIVLLAMQAA